MLLSEEVLTNSIKNICVFASAADDIDEIFYEDAANLGHLIGANGYNIVYGGSHKGLMYACANAVDKSGGKIFAVMPQKMVDAGLANPQDCEEFHITMGMRERKAKLDEISDAVIAVAGGIGTLEEITEMMVQKQLGYSNKPTIILNTNGFYDNFIEFLYTMEKHRFTHGKISDVVYFANTPEDAINYIKNYVPQKVYSRLD